MLETLKLCCCLYLVARTLAQANSLPPSEEISQVSFLQDQLFFLTSSKKYFGLISYDSQLYTMQQEVKEGQTVLRFEPEDKYFVLGKEKDKALLFKLAQLNIQEINVQFMFEHQQTIDVLSKNGEIYVLSNTDLRLHSKGQKQANQGANIVTSCRKNEWFMKCFESKGKIIIVLRKEQQLCVRVVKRGEKSKQRCLFNISSEVTEIDRVSNAILVQTKLNNYLIEENLEASSFQGHIAQVGTDFITFSEEFRTFSVSTKNFTSGLRVVGSTEDHQFQLKESDKNEIQLHHNGKIIDNLGSQRPKRAWIHQMKSTLHLLVLQYDQNNIVFKNIALKAIEQDQPKSSEREEQGSLQL